MSRFSARFASLVSLACLPGLALLGGCAARASNPSVNAPGVLADAPGGADGVARAMVDTLAVRLANLELRRIAAHAAGAAEAPIGRDLDARIAVLWGQVRESANRGSAEPAVTRRILHILDARQAGLAVERRQLLAAYTPESPLVRQAAEEEALLERRRAEFHAALKDGGYPSDRR